MCRQIVYQNKIYILQDKKLNSRNDVLYFQNQETQNGLYLKMGTQCAEYEKHILEELKNTNIPVPELITHIDGVTGVVTTEIQGQPLYQMRNLSEKKRLDILYKMGSCLAKIHCQKLDLPNKANYVWDKIEFVRTEKKTPIFKWLAENEDFQKDFVFAHGDYQMGNVLINGADVASIIDWEFAGQGIKEGDIAWAVTARQNCNIYLDEKDVRAFISGYLSVNSINEKALRWYRVKCLLFFYEMVCEEDEKYASGLMKKIESLIAT